MMRFLEIVLKGMPYNAALSQHMGTDTADCQCIAKEGEEKDRKKA